MPCRNSRISTAGPPYRIVAYCPVVAFGEREFWQDGARKCAIGAAAAAAVSIAASQILLGMALACMLLARQRWRLPRGLAAARILFLWTLAAIAFSDAPAAGLPQLKKFYAWLTLVAVLSAASRVEHARWLAWGWLAGGALSALWGCGQFVAKYAAAKRAGTDFYAAYIGARITGFNSHWMTFSGQMMIASMAGAALALWACAIRGSGASRGSAWHGWAWRSCSP